VLITVISQHWTWLTALLLERLAIGSGLAAAFIAMTALAMAGRRPA
jgi:hypothetical protein